MSLHSNKCSPKLGEVYYMNFFGDDSAQQGWRPGIVFQNNTGNQYSPNIIALPVTSVFKKITQPTHVLLSAKESGMAKDSMVLCENPQVMSKKQVGKYITTLPKVCMQRVAEANILASAAIAYLDTTTLLKVHKKAVTLSGINH